MFSFIESKKEEFENVIRHFEEELTSIRTGRAHPALLDRVRVEAYGAQTPLRELASISAPDPQTLVIQPWDKGILKNIEKGVNDANLHVNPVVDGNIIRIAISPLTEETRREIVKTVREKQEQGRQSFRRIRDEIRQTFIEKEREKEITEDDRYRGQKELDDLTQEFQKRLDDIAKKKEAEIMNI